MKAYNDRMQSQNNQVIHGLKQIVRSGKSYH